MAGQGFHLGMAKLVAKELKVPLTKETKVGVLMVDALNGQTGGRRCSHFTGGAGCVIPRYNELRQASRVQSWDSGYKKSYLVDPGIDMHLFEAASMHISGGDYKDGIRMHLLADKWYDHLVQNVLFDVSRQKDGIIIHNATGKEMGSAEFRNEIYQVYSMLDQLVMNMAGVTAVEVQNTKQLLSSV